MKRATSTSLWGTPTTVPSWVKPNQGSVFLSGFYNDLPRRVDTMYKPPVVGAEGMFYFNRADKRMYVYSNDAWNAIGGGNTSEFGSTTQSLLSATHLNGQYVSLTKDNTGTINDQNTFQILPGQSAILEATLLVQEKIPTDATKARTCKFHFHFSRDLNGAVLQSSDPLLFYYTDPPPLMRVTVTSAGLINLTVSAPLATSQTMYQSIAHCNLIMVG